MSNTNQIFKEAVELIENGEYEKACRIIFNCEVKKDIINYFVRRGRVSDDALYIFEDGILVFIDIVKKGKLKNHENLSGFLFKICRNISKKSRVIEAERKKLLEEYPELVFTVSGHEPELRNNGKKALNAYKSLGDRCKEIMKMKYVWDYSHGTIAKKMNYTTDVSKAMLHNCLQELLKRMERMSSVISEEELENLRDNLEKDED